MLTRFVSKKTTVLLPEYPTTELRDALTALGFTTFVAPQSDEVVDLDGLQVMIHALVSPTDGPIGDSALWLRDATTTLLNQNDARPTDLSVFAELGHVDAHLLQYSGAIWYPMVYELTEKAKAVFGKQKRARQFDRTLRYMDDLKASYVFGIAGPPCFLDEDLWQFNDIFGDEGNIFPDQMAFERYLAGEGRDNHRLLIPGSVADLAAEGCPVTHPVDPEREIFGRKEAYLREYQARKLPELEAEKATWPHPEIDILGALKPWFEGLLADANRMAEGVGGPVRFVAADPERGDVDLVIDFPAREVREYAGEKVRYAFRTERRLVEHLIAIGEGDWVNSLFLSCRFSATRVGPYNEYVYTFFKCLSEERSQYAEGWYAEQNTDTEDTTLDGWVVQRRCPHLKADLSKFGAIEEGVLTCQMHGWKWRLEDGKCLTSVGHDLRSQRAGATEPDEAPAAQ
jgi:UDP-MurNAc hydroxylase